MRSGHAEQIQNGRYIQNRREDTERTGHEPAKRRIRRAPAGPDRARERAIREDQRQVRGDERRKRECADIGFTEPTCPADDEYEQRGAERAQPLEKTADHHLRREQPSLRIAWREPHHVGLFRLHFERNGTGRIDDELHEDDVNRHEHERPPEEHRDQRDAGNRHMNREDVRRRLLDVVVDAASQADGPHNRRKVIVEQHQRGCLAGRRASVR